MPNFMELPARFSATPGPGPPGPHCHGHDKRHAALAEGANLGGMSVPQGLQNLQNLPNLPGSQSGKPWKNHGKTMEKPWITWANIFHHKALQGISRHSRSAKLWPHDCHMTPYLGLIWDLIFLSFSCPLGKAFKVFRVFKAGTPETCEAPPQLVPC